MKSAYLKGWGYKMESSNQATQTNLVERETIVVNRLQLSQDFIHPEQVR